jgi:hypothetical protein
VGHEAGLHDLAKRKKLLATAMIRIPGRSARPLATIPTALYLLKGR